MKKNTENIIGKVTGKMTAKMTGKHVPRIYEPRPLTSDASLRLDDAAQCRHLVQVLRLGIGAEIRLFNADYGEFSAKITAMDKKSLNLIILQQIAPPPSPPKIIKILYFALIKRDALGFLLEKSTELGVDILQPMTSDYSQNEAFTLARAAIITKDAAEQSRRLRLPIIHPPRPMAELFAATHQDEQENLGKIIFCCVEKSALPPLLSTAQTELTQLKSDGNTKLPLSLGLVIGPEGGFSSREVALMSGDPSARLISLGKGVLRSETAALAGMALLQSLSNQIFND